MKFFAVFCIATLPLFPADGVANRALAVLEKRCFACHAGSMAMSDLKLDSQESLLRGGKRGSAKPLLLDVVEHRTAPHMPPGDKLPESEIATLREWTASGTPWPSVAQPMNSSVWWSFKQPVRPATPTTVWGSSTIDRFIAAGHQTQKLAPGKKAPKESLARRAYLDLWGITPTADQIKKFMEDSSPTAWPKLIDELLASPRYGERWGRHWLDLARYGDTAGFEQDPNLLYAWRYRDYVIDAFNNDKPYDRFVKEQIAGDELYPDDPLSAQGTGFYTVGANRDMLYKVEDMNREENLTDFVDTTLGVFKA